MFLGCAVPTTVPCLGCGNSDEECFVAAAHLSAPVGDGYRYDLLLADPAAH